jgi:hypothetical protein
MCGPNKLYLMVVCTSYECSNEPFTLSITQWMLCSSISRCYLQGVRVIVRFGTPRYLTVTSCLLSPTCHEPLDTCVSVMFHSTKELNGFYPVYIVNFPLNMSDTPELNMIAIGENCPERVTRKRVKESM